MTAFAVWAPGRVNLIGEHTDYAGGLVLPVAIQYGIELRVDRAQDDVELTSEELGRGPAFSADGGGAAPAGWVRYAHGVAAELAALGRPPVGLAGTIHSTVPTGAGLSSSAALVVSVALALCEVADFHVDRLELAQACRRGEARAIGVGVGILDQSASLLCAEGHALLLDCATLEHRLVRLPERAALVVLDSGVQHRHDSSGYADRRRELEAGMAERARHVETENRRVGEFVEALERGDLTACGALLLQTHASLRDDYEVSVPETDLLVELALDAGALGARIVGGGFGGSVLALTDEGAAAGLARRVAGEYRRRTGTAREPLIARASRGAEVRA